MFTLTTNQSQILIVTWDAGLQNKDLIQRRDSILILILMLHVQDLKYIGGGIKYTVRIFLNIDKRKQC